jgi:hypothetical protein
MIFVWSGLIVISAIALLAVAHFLFRLTVALRNVQSPTYLNALSALALGLVVTCVLLIGAWLLASRGGTELRVALVGGILLLLVVRVTIDLLIDARLRGEPEAFDSIARGMLAGSCCFGDRSPGYSLLLAGAYYVLGPNSGAGELLNLLLAVMAGAVLFKVVALHADSRAGILALYLFALWPAGAMLANVRLSETFYILVLLLAALALMPRAGPGLALVAGALLAIGQYIRPTTLALVPAYLLAAFWPTTPVADALRRTALPLGAAMLLVLVPVAAYNLQAHGELSLASSSFGGWSLYIGTDERTHGQLSTRAEAEIAALTRGGVWEDSRAAGKKAIAAIIRHPMRLVRLAPFKFDTLWGTENFGVYYAMSREAVRRPLGTMPVLMSGLFWAVLTVGTAASVFRRRRDLDRLTVLCLAVVLTVSLIHVFAEVRDRYHAYVTPLMIAVFAIGLAGWAATRWPADRSVATPVTA